MGTRRAVKSAQEKTLRRGTHVASKHSSSHRKSAGRPASRPHPHQAKPTKMGPAEKSFRDDPFLDRRIIEGMLSDRSDLMSEMAKQGYGDEAVLRRAAELGLSEALIRQVRGVAADLAGERPGRKSTPPTLGARTCLSCDRVFLSTGPGNRLCMRCRGGDAGLAQL